MTVAIQPTLAFHYCGGHLASIKFFGDESKKCACGMENEEQSTPDAGFTSPVMPCCSNNVVKIATDDFQSAQETLIINADLLSAPFALLLPSTTSLFGEQDALFTFQHTYPPGGLPKCGTDILALNCVFRI
jgi:hypothetical protein